LTTSVNCDPLRITALALAFVMLTYLPSMLRSLRLGLPCTARG